MNDMTVTFLGVRGSAFCAGKHHAKYGGHTSCVMIQVGDTLIFLDAGSGLFDANELLHDSHQDIHVLLSHAHLDHIIGLPFLSHVWRPQQNIHIYAGNLQPYGGVKQVLQKVFEPPLFPIGFADFPANIETHDVTPGVRMDINSEVSITTCPLQHPNGAMAYRVHYKDKSVCYVTDTEHGGDGLDEHIVKLIQDSDLFIYDASFTDETYPSYKGWGHSTWQEACRLGEAGNVKRTGIFHHSPHHTDDVLQAIESDIQKCSPNTVVLRQGMTIKL